LRASWNGRRRGGLGFAESIRRRRGEIGFLPLQIASAKAQRGCGEKNAAQQLRLEMERDAGDRQKGNSDFRAGGWRAPRQSPVYNSNKVTEKSGGPKRRDSTRDKLARGAPNVKLPIVNRRRNPPLNSGRR